MIFTDERERRLSTVLLQRFKKLGTSTFVYPSGKPEVYVQEQWIMWRFPAGQTTWRQYSDICDSSCFTSNDLFFQQKHALRVQLYYDDSETAKPSGSKKGIHKLFTCVTNGMTYLKRLINDHPELFRSLFPDRRSIPKQHIIYVCVCIYILWCIIQGVFVK